MGERVGRREIEGKMEVNEGKDGKISERGWEKSKTELEKESAERGKEILERRRRKEERVEK